MWLSPPLPRSGGRLRVEDVKTLMAINERVLGAVHFD
jgi:hypothetical protein